MATKKKLLQAAAGVGGAALNIEDVFSTYLYTGTGSNQTITNGIDLSGEGGMTWIKRRNLADSHLLTDSERGYGQILQSDTTGANQNLQSLFNLSTTSSGFTIGSANTLINASGSTYASWTFRKAPKFFTCLTYTGDGANSRTISHDLGADVGMVIIKRTDSTSSWAVWHRGLTQSGGTGGGAYNLVLEATNAQFSTSYINSTTSSSFTVGGGVGFFNNSGATFVAYLFAHNDGDGGFGPTGDQDIIKCGSFTTDGSGDVAEIDLGFEPQWIMLKKTSGTGDWRIGDVMRGDTVDNSFEALKANTSDAESTLVMSRPTATGYKIDTGFGTNATGIYIAIRRGPMAVPTSGTDVFAIKRHAGADGPQPAGITSDMLITTNSEVANTERFNFNRLTNGKVLYTSQTFAEGNYSAFLNFGTNNGVNTTGLWGNTSVPIYYHFKRAPSFCDVVAYTGNATSGHTITHNLGVAPEMIWVKKRNSTSNSNWFVYHSGTGNGKYLIITGAFGVQTSTTAWNDTDPTETTFTLGNNQNVNNSGDTYIAYLFASLAGVSKVGSYTGNGSTQTIDCGFSSGARFVLIKRTDSTGDWYVWDTERGIVAANDPHLSLNSTAAQVTTDDSVDPVSSGFAVNQVSATNINVSSASYIFYAVS